MKDVFLAFGLMIVFGIFANLIIILKRGNIKTIKTMGIELEDRCPEISIDMIDQENCSINHISGVFLFVEEECITCQTIINGIEMSKLRNEKIFTILVGERSNAVHFMEEHPSWKRVGYINMNIIKEKLNISAFPFFMLLQDGIVKEKGFPEIDKIMSN